MSDDKIKADVITVEIAGHSYGLPYFGDPSYVPPKYLATLKPSESATLPDGTLFVNDKRWDVNLCEDGSSYQVGPDPDAEPEPPEVEDEPVAWGAFREGLPVASAWLEDGEWVAYGRPGKRDIPRFEEFSECGDSPEKALAPWGTDIRPLYVGRKG